MNSRRNSMRSWHRRVVAKLVYFGSVYGILSGIISTVIDYEHQRIITHKLFTIYAFVINALQLISIPLVFFRVKNYVRSFESNEFMYACDCVWFIVKFGVTALVILMRCFRERVFVYITKKFFQYENLYFDAWSTDEIERRINFAFFLKFFTTTMQSVITFTTTVFVLREVNTDTLLAAWYLANMQNILHGTFFFYVTALTYIWWGFEAINLQVTRVFELKPLWQRRHLHVSDMITQLRGIARVHLELTRTSVLLSDSLRFTTLCILLVYLFQYIIYGYYSLMLIRTVNYYPLIGWLLITIGFIFYLILLLDLYFFYWMGDIVSRVQQSTVLVLSDFQKLRTNSARPLERQLECFALQMTVRKLKINCGNMFQINRSSALTVGAYIMRNILLLVQFQYEQRLNALNETLKSEHRNPRL